MRVRISYSVELEEVPQEVTRLLEETNNQVTDLRDSIDELVSQLEADTMTGHRAVSTIKELRQILTKVDHQLVDSGAILEGYFNAIKQPEDDHVSEG